jgi:uncharacterized membrane protein
MADVLTRADVPELPAIRTIGPADLKDALRRGIDDFQAMPTHAAFLSLIYPLVGLVIGRAMLGYELVPMLFPLAAGFALIGPFAAIGLYELSRQREQGGTPHWTGAFDVWHAPSFGSIVALGAMLFVVFGVWIAIAHSIYIAHFGYREPQSLFVFLNQVLTTREGWSMMLIGNTVGFLFAVAVLSISAVSFPLLLDRKVGLAAAMLTSVRVVIENPITMALWGVIVAAALILGSLPFLLGLPIVMPILGHATWHLYRKAVVPDGSPEHGLRQRPEGGRYAADFPVSLLPWARDRVPPGA